MLVIRNNYCMKLSLNKIDQLFLMNVIQILEKLFKKHGNKKASNLGLIVFVPLVFLMFFRDFEH